MIPSGMTSRRLELPTEHPPTIVIATGDEPRHVRFALRLQQAFGSDVIAWFQLTRPARAATPPQPSPLAKGKQLVKRLLGRPLPAPPRPSIFVREIEHLRTAGVVSPRPIAASHIHEPAFVAELQALNPFFFLTLGGGLYGQAVLSTVRGVAINQHAGFSPEYKGNQTTFQALYHRDLGKVASTVHVTTTGADAGPMLRRSHPCLMPTDSPLMVAERVVALGTELMIECVREIRTRGSILAFDQPLTGVTYLSRDYDEHVRTAVAGDFARGWLAQAMQRRLQW